MGERLSTFRWLLAGTVVLVLFGLVFFRFSQDPTERLTLQAKKVELVAHMHRNLESASEAEKRAVLAITDKDSQTYADEARAASATVEQERRELEAVLQAGKSQKEKDLLGQFSRAFSEYQRVDKEVLALAVKNTNLKAASLAFGPAAEALKEMDTALSHIVTESASSSSSQAKRVMLLASGAQAAALRIQGLLPPHIAEESDKKMDEFEALMAKEDQDVRRDLEALTALQREGADLQTAKSRYARFSEIRIQILALSRENTNVRSLSLSLNQKRQVTLRCEEALTALEKAFHDDPNTYAPVKPR